MREHSRPLSEISDGTLAVPRRVIRSPLSVKPRDLPDRAMSCSGFIPPRLHSSNTVSRRVSSARIFLPLSVMVVKSYFTPSEAVIAMPMGVACSVPMCMFFGAEIPRIVSRVPTATRFRSSPSSSATSSGRPGSRLPPPTRNTT